MTFEVKFNSKPMVTNVNLRKEGAEHDILAVDVDVNGEVPGSVAGELLGCSNRDAKELLWHQDIEGHPARMTGITAITSWAKFENCNLEIAGMKFDGVVAKKFKLKPVGGGALHLSMQIQISRIPDEHVGRLGECVRENTDVYVRGEEDMFPNDEEGEEPGEGGEAA